jgi:hypothetical protein
MTFTEIIRIVAIAAVITAVNVWNYIRKRDGAGHSGLSRSKMLRYVGERRQERKKIQEEVKENEASKAW